MLLLLLVTPGRMMPLSSGGVTSSLFPVDLFCRKANTFMAPTSVTSWSGPKSHRTYGVNSEFCLRRVS